MPETPQNGGHRGGPIEYWERPPYTEKNTQDGGEVTRTCMVDWHHARDFPAAMLGDVECGGGGRLKRFLPDKHPHGRKQLWAAECHLVNGHGAWTDDGVGLITFDDNINKLPGKAEFRVTYRQPPYAVLPDRAFSDPAYPELHRWVIKECKVNMESYQLPGVAFYWEGAEEAVKAAAADAAADAAPPVGVIPEVLDALGFARSPAGQRAREFNKRHDIIPEGMAKQRGVVELTYTWVWVPEPINVKMFNVVGKINEIVFPGDSYRCQANHLLCLPPTISERKWTPRGTPVRDITYHLAWRLDSSWNHYYRSTVNQFVKVLTLRHALGKEPDPKKISVYEPTSFSPLFSCAE